MKIKNMKVFLYVIIVIIPTIILTTLGIDQRIDSIEEEENDHLRWVASIHKQQFEQLMMESTTSIEILALSLEELLDNHPLHLDNIERLLEKTKNADPRYGGLYVLDSKGILLYGTDKTFVGANLINKDYIQSVLLTQNTIVSDNQVTLSNELNILPIVAPILDSHSNTVGIVMAHIRVDYLVNVMNILTPDQTILVNNINGDPVFGMNLPENFKTQQLEWSETPLEMLPWSILILKEDTNLSPYLGGFIVIGLITFFLSNVCYIIAQYIMLVRRAAHEKSQNEAQKLELVGTLAASTAHEIRNPLTGIKGLIQLLSEKYKSEDDQLYFKVIDKEVERINQIVSEFLILGKPTVLKTETLDLRNILDEIKPLIQSEANLYNVVLSCSYPDRPLLISSAKDQLKQVILNITKNAFESMEDEGTLAIDVQLKQNKVALTITDTGVGMSPEELTHIFQPFYTSKTDGTGLGLVVCKRIIQSFGGQISIHSQKNKGTKVIIELPNI
ncbi:sporulation kinase KinD [Bacillus carboniphilus]|uniref:histidine kinase n=1 Tax=Bacillus carboniphilus TaxID=86663 RepID=A0ABN0W3X9_9BACI